MIEVRMELPEGVMAALRRDPEGFARDMRLAAAAKWYELRMVSQERAAEIAGLSRAEFLDALGGLGVSPFQAGIDEVLEEAGRE
jgi:predicted HTH domain antitoxin